nr:energy transducer TonB [uncultured Desulfobulbus sp.]
MQKTLLTHLLDDSQETKQLQRPPVHWSLPLLAALLSHGLVFGGILASNLPVRQAPIPVGAPLPVTLYAALPGATSSAPRPIKTADPAPATPREDRPEPVQKPREPQPTLKQKPVTRLTPAPKKSKIRKKRTPTPPKFPATKKQTASSSSQEKTLTTGSEITSNAQSGTAGGAARAVIAARPRYRSNPPPVYPELARRRQLEGTVVLEVLVNTRGRVDALALHNSSGHRILDRAAQRAVRSWLFIPGREGGNPIQMKVLVPVRFALH